MFGVKREKEAKYARNYKSKEQILSVLPWISTRKALSLPLA
jgi:hypothetical protein